MKWVLKVCMLVLLGANLFGSTIQQQQYRESFWSLYTEALRGDKVAQYQVGVIYERGIGVDKNETKAAEWYEKSAEQGFVDAQYNIAIMYAAGRGVEENEAKAMMWFALAAKQGDKESRQLLMKMIDGKLMPAAKEKSGDVGLAYSADEHMQSITPVTLVCKIGAVVCTQYGKQGECTPYKEKSVFTSKEKKGTFYKISGIVINHRWKDYDKEGWIEEESVEIRK